MKMIIVDSSKGVFRKKSEKELKSICVQIAPRTYIGDLPMRSIKALIERFKPNATKSTNIVFLIESNDGYHGWKCFQIGKKDNNFSKFESFSYVLEDLLK
jgi:hypothetical protein